jgi:hypothetical protein
MRWWSRRRAVAVQVVNEAELPRPAPTGSVDLTVKLNDGLNQCQSELFVRQLKGSTGSYLSPPCAITMYKYKNVTAAALARTF